MVIGVSKQFSIANRLPITSTAHRQLPPCPSLVIADQPARCSSTNPAIGGTPPTRDGPAHSGHAICSFTICHRSSHEQGSCISRRWPSTRKEIANQDFLGLLHGATSLQLPPTTAMRSPSLPAGSTISDGALGADLVCWVL